MVQVAARGLARGPYFRGRDRLVRFLLCRVARRRPRRITIDGLTFGLDLCEGFSRLLFLGRSLPDPSPLIERLVTPGAVVVDVGANIGHTAMAAARATGPGGRVLAFEPVGASHEMLVRNLALNGFDNVDTRKAACGAEAGRVPVFVDPSVRNYASLRPVEGLTEEQHMCDVVRLEDELRQRDLAPDLVKVDVEGGEWSVLAGLGGLLGEGLPTLIIEMSSANMARFGYSPVELARWLVDLGYRLEVLIDERLVAYSEELVTGEVIRDVLAVDPGRHEVVAARTEDMRDQAPVA